jgi:hypothetical protein
MGKKLGARKRAIKQVKLRQLTARQARFVTLVTSGGLSIEESCRAAGYTGKNAKYRIPLKPHVQAAVARATIQQAKQEDGSLSPSWLADQLIAAVANPRKHGQMQALRLLRSMMRDGQKRKAQEPAPNRFAGMTREQLDARIKEFEEKLSASPGLEILGPTAENQTAPEKEGAGVPAPPLPLPGSADKSDSAIRPAVEPDSKCIAGDTLEPKEAHQRGGHPEPPPSRPMLGDTCVQRCEKDGHGDYVSTFKKAPYTYIHSWTYCPKCTSEAASYEKWLFSLAPAGNR